MDLEKRLRVLEKIYALQTRFCADFDLACGPGCARCCTANVTLTTLEARHIIRYWHHQNQAVPLAAIEAGAGRPRFQPSLTVNRLAALCLQGQPAPEEAADPGVGPCLLLKNQACAIYPARPLACRAMVSRATCVHGGAADMPEEILSANHLLMQFVEALDPAGASGNLVDVLLFLLHPQRLTASCSGQSIPAPPLAAHQTIPALMIPPELRQRLLPLVQAIQESIRSTEA